MKIFKTFSNMASVTFSSSLHFLMHIWIPFYLTPKWYRSVEYFSRFIIFWQFCFAGFANISIAIKWEVECLS